MRKNDYLSVLSLSLCLINVNRFALLFKIAFLHCKLLCVLLSSFVFQGNGHERDFLDDRRVYIMDVYNRHIYPGDGYAKSKCSKLPSQYHITQKVYLKMAVL